MDSLDCSSCECRAKSFEETGLCHVCQVEFNAVSGGRESGGEPNRQWCDYVHRGVVPEYRPSSDERAEAAALAASSVVPVEDSERRNLPPIDPSAAVGAVGMPAEAAEAMDEWVF